MAATSSHNNERLFWLGHRLFYRLLLTFLLTGALIWLVFYWMSPYWYSRDFIQQLQQNNPATAKTLIPEELLISNQAHAAQHLNIQQWQGAGAIYLKQVWPVIARQQDQFQILMFQVNNASEESIQRAYSRFPSRFRLTIGNTAHSTLWFEWRRVSSNSWQLDKLCFYSPQPVDDVNNCSSSTR